MEGIPHALRSIGAIPAAYLFAGLGAYLLYDRVKNKWLEKRMKISVLKGISFLLLFLITLFSFISYFVVWANNPQLDNAFTKRFSEVGKELNALPLETQKYVIENEGDLPTEVTKFIQRTAGRDEAVYIQPQEAATINFSSGDFIFIMNKEIHSLDPVRERFPEGILYEKDEIFIYEIK